MDTMDDRGVSLQSHLQPVADGIERWRRFAEEHRSARAAEGGPPLTSAPAVREEAHNPALAGAWGPDPVRSAHFAAVMQLGAADDYLAALAALVPRPGVTLALDAVVRGLVEACVRAMWLLDPDIDPLTRVARSMTDYLHTSWRASQLPLQSAATASVPLQLLAEDIASSAQAHGLEVYRSRGRPTAVGEERPHSIDLFGRYYKPLAAGLGQPGAQPVPLGELLYRWCSAAAHAEFHGVLSSMLNTLPSVLAGDEFGWPWLESTVLTAMLLHYTAFDWESALFGRTLSPGFVALQKQEFATFALAALELHVALDGRQRRRHEQAQETLR